MKEKIKENTRILIDTNIYLRVHTTNLWEAFLNILDEKKLFLVYPKQIEDEYSRHKEEYNSLGINGIILETSTSYLRKEKENEAKIKKEIEKTNKKIREYNKKLTKEVTNSRKDSLKFLEKEVIKKAIPVEDDREIVQLAFERYLRGNPPASELKIILENKKEKKRGGDEEKNSENNRKIKYFGDVLGDAIIWETMIKKCNDNDLVIISNNVHFNGLMQRNFLIREWKKKTKHNLKIFVELQDFIDQFVTKEVQKELKKEEEKISNKNEIFPNNRAVVFNDDMVSFNTRSWLTDPTLSSGMSIIDSTNYPTAIGSSIFNYNYKLPSTLESMLVNPSSFLVSPSYLICPVCGHKNLKTDNDIKGKDIKCSNPSCGQIFTLK